jgi:hypothetical protein
MDVALDVTDTLRLLGLMAIDGSSDPAREDFPARVRV